jgi:OmpA-OmpF porin, OOP family
MKTGSMAVFVALIFAASGAFAQSPAATRKFYVGVQVGQSTLDRQSSDLGANFDDHDVAYSLLAGYRFSRFYALELGYNDLGGFSAEFPNTCPAAPSCPPDIGNTALKSLVLNNVLVWPIAEHFHLKGTIGMNFYEVSGSLRHEASGTSIDFSDKNGSFNFGLGIGVPINEHLELGLDLTAFREMTVEFGFLGGEEFDQVYETDATLLTLGARYRF